MNDTINSGMGMMIARLGIQAAAGALAAKGWGDDAMWQVVGAAVLSGVGGVMSWLSRRKLNVAAAS